MTLKFEGSSHAGGADGRTIMSRSRVARSSCSRMCTDTSSPERSPRSWVPRELERCAPGRLVSFGQRLTYRLRCLMCSLRERRPVWSRAISS